MVNGGRIAKNDFLIRFFNENSGELLVIGGINGVELEFGSNLARRFEDAFEDLRPGFVAGSDLEFRPERPADILKFVALNAAQPGGIGQKRGSAFRIAGQRENGIFGGNGLTNGGSFIFWQEAIEQLLNQN